MTAIVIHGLYRKKALLELITLTLEGNMFVQNENNPEDRWIIPESVFKSTYELVEPVKEAEAEPMAGNVLFKDSEFDFGIAVRLLKEGNKVARKGWNGKGMWLSYVAAWNYNPSDTNSLGLEKLPWIGMKTADNKFVPWLASQTDVLAEDWTVL